MRNTSIAFILLTATLFADEIRTPEETWPKLKNDNSYNLFVSGDFIDWRYSSPNLAYGRDGVGITNGSPHEIPVTRSGTSFYPDFDYDPGFKVGLGIKFGPQKAFDIVGSYTWLHSEPEGHAENFSASFMPINYLTSNTTASNIYSFASLGLNLHFNWIELQSGYTFTPNKYLSLRPYFSLQAIVLRGDLQARYEFTTSVLAGGVPEGTFEVSKTYGHCSSWSIGPRMGLDFIVHATKNLGIYSNVGWTQQATSLHMSTKEIQEQPANGSHFVIQKGELNTNHNVGIFNLELGPTWDQWFACEKYRLQLRATWFVGTLPTGANLSFLNNNNTDIVVGSEFRGYNIRATFEF